MKDGENECLKNSLDVSMSDVKIPVFDWEWTWGSHASDLIISAFHCLRLIYISSLADPLPSDVPLRDVIYFPCFNCHSRNIIQYVHLKFVWQIYFWFEEV